MKVRNHGKIRMMSRRSRQSIAIWSLTLLMAIYALLPVGNVRAVNLNHSDLWA